MDTGHLQKQADTHTCIHIDPLRGETSRINVYTLVVRGDIARHNIGEYICVHICLSLCIYVCICVHEETGATCRYMYGTCTHTR